MFFIAFSAAISAGVASHISYSSPMINWPLPVADLTLGSEAGGLKAVGLCPEAWIDDNDLVDFEGPSTYLT